MALSLFNKRLVSNDTKKIDNMIKSSIRQKSRSYSRSQSNITDCDIQSWLSNIETPITRENHFQGTNDRAYPFSRAKFKQSLAQMTLDQLRHHDEAQQEAEDLVKDWVQKKLYNTNLVTDDNLHVVDKELKQTPFTDYSDTYGTDSYLNFDEDEALETVLHNMLKKELVPKRITSNLGLDKSKEQYDPSVKMELRQKQVKENRLKREKDVNRRRQEQQMKKEAHLKAYQRIMKEEKLKAAKRQQEEREIQRQMAAIRRQMKAEKKQMKEKKQTDVDHTISPKQIQLTTTDHPQNPATKIIPHQNFSNVEEPVTVTETEQQIAEYEALKVRQKALDIQTLQRHFMAWTSLILHKRVKYGKVSALADWKLLLRHWNAWKLLSVQNKMEKDMQVHQQNMRECQRKEKLAGEHYMIQLMQKCFWAWQLYIHSEKERQRLELSQKETKEKMEKLLNAAASGKITVANSLSTSEMKSKELTKQPEIQKKHVNELKTTDAPYHCDGDNNVIQSLHLSSIPWKASRQLLPVEISQFSQVLMAGTNTQTDSSHQKQKDSQPVPSPNKFQITSIERKLEFQKKFMKEQQKQLKEQKRLIEELQSNQRCNQLKEEISFIEMKTGQRVATNPVPSHKSTIKKRQSVNHRPKAPSTASCPESQNDSYTESCSESYTESRTESCIQSCTDLHTVSRTESCDGLHDGSHDKPRGVSHDESHGGSHVGSRPSTSTSTSNTRRNQTFLNNIEKRAIERKRLKMEREDRKKREIEEKLMIQKKYMEEQLQAEKEKRKAKMKAKEAQKRLEKERKAEQERRMKELEELNSKADDFYKTYLLKVYGILPWKEFIAGIHYRESKAVEMDKFRIMKKTLISWHQHVQELIIEKTDAADLFYENILVKRHFICWKNHKNYQLALEKKAKKYFRKNLCCKAFIAWVNYSNEQTIASWEKEEIAQKFYLRYIVQKMVNSWKLLPDIHRKEEERRQRKAELRQKVALLLPDFDASIDSQVE